MQIKTTWKSEKIYINEIIRINYKCNWKCKFCNVIKTNNYGEQDVTNKEIIYQILQLIKKYPTREQRKNIILSFSWGEPTLNPKLTDFIKLAKSIGIGTVEIQTNGSILFVKKKLILELIDAGLDEVFMAQHSHLPEINKELGAIYRVEDFISWVEFIRKNEIHKKIHLYLNIVVWQINIGTLLDFVSFLKKVGFLDFIGKTAWLTDKGEKNLAKISIGLTQPNGYAELNADKVVLAFTPEQVQIIEKFMLWCDENGYYPDFHFTSPPLCILDYPDFNLEYSRLKKLAKDTVNNTVNEGNLESYKFLWKEKKKFPEICWKCKNNEYCLWFYKNWLKFVWDDYAKNKAENYVKENSSLKLWEDLSVLRYQIIEKNLFSEEIYTHFWSDAEIRYSNFWFIVIPKKSDSIFKIYYDELFFEKNGYKCSRDFFQSEKKHYQIFHNAHIYSPDFEDFWNIYFSWYSFKVAKITNIRKDTPRLTSFLDINPQELAYIISQIHGIEKNFIHGNLHSSNFFVLNWKLWIFDLVDCRIWRYEQDIARIIIDIEWDFWYMNSFLKYYIEKISLNYVLDIAIEHMKYMLLQKHTNHKRSKRILEILLYQKSHNTSEKTFLEYNTKDFITIYENTEVSDYTAILDTLRKE